MADETSMEELAANFRYMQLFAHMAHNQVSGMHFFEDHEFLGELYGTYEGVYDDLIERMIGLDQSPDIKEINDEANEYLQEAEPTAGLGFFSHLLECEEEVCEMIEKLVKEEGLTQATINLLVQIADDAEKRQYKLKQKLGDGMVNEKAGDALDRLAMSRRRHEESEGEEGY